jgi:hypothetical protein
MDLFGASLSGKKMVKATRLELSSSIQSSCLLG